MFRKNARQRVVIGCGLFLAACTGKSVETGVGGPDRMSGAGAVAKTLQPIAVTADNDAAVRRALQAQVDAQMRCAEPLRYDVQPDVAVPTSATDDAGLQFTDTNVQEAGIDEVDQLKMFDTLAILVRGDSVAVMQVWPTNAFKTIATIPVEGRPFGLLRTGDHALAVLSDMELATTASKPLSVVTITRVDLANPATPTIVGQFQLEGNYETARSVQGRIALVLHQWNPLARALPDDFQPYAADCEARLPVWKSEAERRVATMALNGLLPQRTVLSPGNSNPAQISRWFSVAQTEAAPATGGWLSIINLPREGETQLAEQMIAGDFPTIYVSPQHLFAAYQSHAAEILQNLPDDAASTPHDTSVVHVFDMATDTPAYQGSTEVPGWLINQFAMSEENNILRVATTQGHVRRDGESGSSSGIYTFALDQADRAIAPLGQVEGLGTNEQIYAVRFVGDRGYVVTFKKVDPLFVVDLSDPANPAVRGALKIPGYSTYLHPLANGRLVDLGKDAQDEGNFAWYQGLKLSLFNVASADTPVEVANAIIGTRGTDSAALNDHHAFTFDATRNVVALPVEYCSGEPHQGARRGTFQYAGVHLYQITDTAVTLQGIWKLPSAANAASVNGALMGGWYGAATRVERTVLLSQGEQRAMLVLHGMGVALVDVGTMQTVAAQQWE